LAGNAVAAQEQAAADVAAGKAAVDMAKINLGYTGVVSSGTAWTPYRVPPRKLRQLLSILPLARGALASQVRLPQHSAWHMPGRRA